MNRKLGTLNRLQFEEDLTSSLRGNRASSFRLGRATVFLVSLALIAALALGASHFLRTSNESASWEPLAHTCNVVFEALCTDKVEDVLSVCLEGERGRALLTEEQQRLQKGGTVKARAEEAIQKNGRVSSVEFLRAIRTDLAKEGAVWEEAKPLAFGGIHVKLVDSRNSPQPTESVIAELYFTTAGKVYALEFTARKCGAEYLITDFWQCRPANITPDQVSAHSAEWFQNFTREPSRPDEKARIKSPTHVFVPLNVSKK